MIKIEDLRKVCPKCEGAGFVQDWQWIQWWAENNTVPPEGHPLLEVREEIPCEGCGEIGFIPTEQGEILLSFLNLFRGRK
jgi:hypothetical protein